MYDSLFIIYPIDNTPIKYVKYDTQFKYNMMNDPDREIVGLYNINRKLIGEAICYWISSGIRIKEETIKYE